MATGSSDSLKPTHRLAELLSALSFASDMGIGLPLEYGARCCYISLCVGQKLGLSTAQLNDLYYAELIKMAGCTCGAHEFASFIGGDEIAAIRDTIAVDPSSHWQFLSWMLNHVGVGAPAYARVARIFDFFLHGREIFREGTRGQCEVGRRIAQRLGLTTGVQEAILQLCLL